MKTFKYFLLSLFSFTLIYCSDNGDDTDTKKETPTIDNSAFNIWTGDAITFTKTSGSDPSMAENQDRITDNVWLTRGNNGGQIFNIKEETSSNKATSPVGTTWALGNTKTTNIASLTFETFRTDSRKPANLVDKDLILHLVKDDIYLDVKFISWSQSKTGGFSYTRSTPNN